MDLLLVRHGEIPSNIKKVYAGKSPEKLTEKGIAQAVEVSDNLMHYNINALYSSPVQRAVQTAKIIGDRINKDFVVEDAFREFELGPWEGLSEDEIARIYPEEWNVWKRRPSELHLPGREMLEELLKRVLEGVKKIHRVMGGKTVVIVTHVAIIRVLLLYHVNKSLNLYKTIHVPNAGVFEIKISDGMCL